MGGLQVADAIAHCWDVDDGVGVEGRERKDRTHGRFKVRLQTSISHDASKVSAAAVTFSARVLADRVTGYLKSKHR